MGRPVDNLDYLIDSYVRRKRFESKLLAVEIWTLLGDAMGSKQKENLSDSQLMKLGFGVKRGN